MKHICVLLLGLLITFSSQAQSLFSSLQIVDSTTTTTFGFFEAQRSPDSIDIIVIHSSYCLQEDSFSTQGCIEQFKQYGVAPHYLIARNGQIIQMVEEKNIALHAGDSRLPGTDRLSLNTSSIGIEIINTPHCPPTSKQYKTLLKLVKSLCERYAIKFVVRHSDIASWRKSDPWQFDWERFTNRLATICPDLRFPS